MKSTAKTIRHISSLKSQIDHSVNFVGDYKGGLVEARYVRRTPDKVIAYVSSHNGCKMACKMCHLTATGQTKFAHMDVDGYADQLNRVLSYYEATTALEAGSDRSDRSDRSDVSDNLTNSTTPTDIGSTAAFRLNVNFMARGEPFANKYVLGNYSSIYARFKDLAAESGLKLKVNISTIMPRIPALTARPLHQTLGWHDSDGTLEYNKKVYEGAIYPIPEELNQLPHIYYSMYSLNPTFRGEYLKNAMPVHEALNILKEYEDFASRFIDTPLTFHWAYIKGKNDSREEARTIAKELKSRGFRAKFNLVRFNPYMKSTDVEPEEPRLQELLDIINSGLGHPRSYIVPRVGKDVYASCGMFIEE